MQGRKKGTKLLQTLNFTINQKDKPNLGGRKKVPSTYILISIFLGQLEHVEVSTDAEILFSLQLEVGELQSQRPAGLKSHGLASDLVFDSASQMTLKDQY